MKLACPKCGQHLEAPDDSAGSIGICPNCKAEFELGPRFAVPPPCGTPPAPPPPPAPSPSLGLSPTPAPAVSTAVPNVRIQCARCKAVFHATGTCIGQLVKCPKCQKPFTAQPAPPEPPPVARTIGDSCWSVAATLVLLFLVSVIGFAGSYSLAANGEPGLAWWFWQAGVLFAALVPVTWFIWSLACLRTIALCHQDASAERREKFLSNPNP